MRKILILSMVILLVLLLIQWQFHPEEPPEKQKSLKPNVVTFQANEGTSDQPKDDLKKPAQKAASPEPFVVDQPTNDDPDQKPPKAYTYLDVYRMTRLFNHCDNEIYRLISDPKSDPIHVLQSKLKRLTPPNQPLIVPTPAQQQAVIKHQQQCQQLLDQINAADVAVNTIAENQVEAIYQQTRIKLQDWLAQTLPKTAKEQAIAEVFKLREQWQSLFSTVIQVSQGEESKNQVEIDALRQQSAALQLRIDEILDAMKLEDNNAALNEELGDVSMQYNEIDEQIQNLLWVDPEVRNQAIANFEMINAQLFRRLTSQDPDVFYETQMTLERIDKIRFFGFASYKDIGQYKVKMPFVEYVSPGEVVQQIIQMPDDDAFSLVVQYATQLYHCELGADCGPDSVWVKYYCFQSYDKIDAASCNLDLASYLQFHRLSNNHWQDVVYVWDTLRGLYGS